MYYTLLGGSWLVISRVNSRVTVVVTDTRGLIPPLITTHEPPSSPEHSTPKSKPRNPEEGFWDVLYSGHPKPLNP